MPFPRPSLWQLCRLLKTLRVHLEAPHKMWHQANFIPFPFIASSLFNSPCHKLKVAWLRLFGNSKTSERGEHIILSLFLNINSIMTYVYIYIEFGTFKKFQF